MASKDEGRAGATASVIIALAAFALALPVVRHWPITDTSPGLLGERGGVWIVMVSSLLLVVSWCAAIGRSLRFGWVVLLLPAFWPLYDANVGVWLTARELDYSELAGDGIGLMIGYTIVARRSIMGLFIGHETAPAERMRRRFKWWVLRRAIRDRAMLPLITKTIVIWGASSAGALLLVMGFSWWVERDLAGAGPGGGMNDVAFVLPLIAVVVLSGAPGAVIHLMRKILLLRSAHYAGLHPCFRCDRSCWDQSYDRDGWAVCRGCGERLHRGQWIAPPVLLSGRPPLDWRLLLRDAAVSAGAVAAAFALAALIAVALDGFHPLVLLFWSLLLTGFVLCWIMLLSIQQMRRTIERIYANQHVRCRECDYDLKGTPVDRGVGVCPECGVEFADFSGGAADARGS